MTLARSEIGQEVTARGEGRSPAATADAALVARETALPGLATLLDQNAFVAAFAAAVAPVTVRGPSVLYLRYKPHTSCLVLYRVELDGKDTMVYARAHRATAHEKLASASGPTVPAPPGGASSLVLRELSVAIHLFPDDRRLRGLGHVTDPKSRRRLLEKAVPGNPELWRADLRPLRYKPERRFVGVLEGEGERRAVLKLHAEREFRHALGAARALGRGLGTDQAGGRLPRLLGRSRRRGMIVSEWLEGRSLEALVLAPDGDPRCAARAGHALANLHDRRLPGLSPWSGRDASRRLREEVDAIAHVEPRLAETAAAVAARAAEEIAGAPPFECPLHGDFSADQVLLGDDDVAFLDLDEAGFGPPGGDLGSFAARVEFDALRGRLSPQRAREATEALLEGYRRSSAAHGVGEWENLRPHAAAALLRLALEPFRYRDPEWPSLTRATIERAQALGDNG